MADETLFDLLHSEIINYALEQNTDIKKHPAITKHAVSGRSELDDLQSREDFHKMFLAGISQNGTGLGYGSTTMSDADQKKSLLRGDYDSNNMAHAVGLQSQNDWTTVRDFCIPPPMHWKDTNLSIVEYIGFASGYRIMERLTREWPRFKDELDTMKFICTDFWTCIYKKQIDNLRTNHQGVYMLQDNAFRFLTRFSNAHQYLEFAPRYVAYTCGLIRGGLANLGINSVVTAEVQTMPSCKFHIQVQRS